MGQLTSFTPVVGQLTSFTPIVGQLTGVSLRVWVSLLEFQFGYGSINSSFNSIEGQLSFTSIVGLLNFTSIVGLFIGVSHFCSHSHETDSEQCMYSSSQLYAKTKVDPRI